MYPIIFRLTLDTSLFMLFGDTAAEMETGADIKAREEFGDAINLAQVWGLGQERGKEAVCEEVGKLIRLAKMKRTSFSRTSWSMTKSYHPLLRLVKCQWIPPPARRTFLCVHLSAVFFQVRATQKTDQRC